MRPFLLALLAASFLAAQPADLAKNARLEGQVVSTTGEPVKNATLQLLGSAQQDQGQAPTTYSQSSDNNGKFVFEALAPGTYRLLALKDGFSRRRVDSIKANHAHVGPSNERPHRQADPVRCDHGSRHRSRRGSHRKRAN